MQQDRDHRRNRKKEYAGEHVRVFVNGIPRFQAKADVNGRMMSRFERTEKFLQAMRIHTNRIHTLFPRGHKSFKFLVEATYETSFRAPMIEMNCAAVDSFNPDLSRNPHQATEAERLEDERISLEQYARQSTRVRGKPTAQTFYRNKGIELVGAEAFNAYCRQYAENQAARRSRSSSPSDDTTAVTNLVRPRSDDVGFATPNRRKRIMSDDPLPDRY